MKDILIFLGMMVFISGCEKGPRDAAEMSASKDGPLMAYDALADSAEIVRVNGVVLTKAELEREVEFMMEMTRLRLPKTAESAWPGFRREMIGFSVDRFIRRTLYHAEAARAELTEPKLEDVVAVSNNFVAMAGQVGGDFNSLKKKLTPASAGVLDDRLITDALVQTYLKLKAGKELLVTDEDYAKYCDFSAKQIAWSKKEYEKAMALGKELIKRFHDGEDFGALADKYSIAIKPGMDGEGGVWGEYLPSTLLDEEVRQAVRKTAVGDCTNPIDTPEGLFIVLVESRKGSGDNSTVNLDPETLKMRRIVLRLPKMYKTMPREMFKSQRMAEKFLEVQNETYDRLRAKAEISYPHGSNCWLTVSKDK